MAIHEVEYAVNTTPANSFPRRYITFINFPNLTGNADIQVLGEIVNEYASQFFPLASSFAYMVTWVVSLQLVSQTPGRVKIFDGNPPRRNFGFYSIGRGNAVAFNDLVLYETQTCRKASCFFTNARNNVPGGVFAPNSSPASVTLYFGAGSNGSLAQAQINSNANIGATRWRAKFLPGTVWNAQIQAQVDFADLRIDQSILLTGDVL